MQKMIGSPTFFSRLFSLEGCICLRAGDKKSSHTCLAKFIFIGSTFEAGADNLKENHLINESSGMMDPLQDSLL